MTTKMTKILIATVLATLAAGFEARAGAPEPPRPAPELDALGKLEGRWVCKGEQPAGPMGPARRYQSTFRYVRGLGGFFWLSEYEQAGSKGGAPGLSARGFLRWDGGYRFEAFLSNGAKAAESVAFDGTSYVGTGEMHAGPQVMGLRETIKLDGVHLTWTGELKMGDQYTTIGRDSCERAEAGRR